jgi:hypothetical protein
MAKITHHKSKISAKEAGRLLDLLKTQATKASDENVKKILLSAGCDIADLVLFSEGEIARAA